MSSTRVALVLAGSSLLSLFLAACSSGGHGGGGGSAPTITTPGGAVGTATEGTFFSFTLTATGGTGSITWSTTSTNPSGGLRLNSSGTITGTPTGPAGTSPSFLVVASDSTGKSSSEVTFSVNVNNYPVPTPNAGTLPNGIVGVAYATQAISVNGGHAPFTVTATGTPPGLKVTAGATTTGSDITGIATQTSAVTISGKPTTTSSSDTITLTITDSSNPPQTSGTITYPFQVTSTAPACPLLGQYAFLMQGFDSNGEYQVVGSVTVNSKGGIVAGEEDYKSRTTTATAVGFVTAVLSSCTNGSITNSGTLSLMLSSGSPAGRTYTFVMGVNGLGRIAETDGLANVSGIIQQQNSSTFSGFHGDYSFGLAGNDHSGNRLALAGAFCTNGSFAMTQFVADMTSNGTPTSEVNLTSGFGTFGPIDGNGRLALGAPIVLSTNPAVSVLFSAYIVTAEKAFAIEASPQNSNNPNLGGQIIRQAGIHGCVETYGNVSVMQSIVTTWGAAGGASYTSLAHLGSITLTSGSTSQGTVSLFFDQNAGGTVLLQNGNGVAIAASYTVESLGRVTFTYTTSNTKQHTAHAYLYGSAGDAFFVGGDADSAIGFVRAQDPTSGIEVPTGTYAFGTIFTPTPTAVQEIGTVTLTGNSYSGQASGANVSGGITPDTDLATTGRGTATASPSILSSTNLVFDAVNPTTLVMMGIGNDSGTNDNIGTFDQ